MIDNNDMSDTIIVKSDQLNYSDFLGKETKVIKITRVDKNEGAQSATIHYEGENGKPYKPSKGMRVAIILCWGKFKDAWVGKSIELFGEPSVRWKGEPQGGIQIKSASHIDDDITFLLTISNKKRVPFTISKLEVKKETIKPLEAEKETIFTLSQMEESLNSASSLEILTSLINSFAKTKSGKENLDRLKVVAGERKKLFEGK